MTQEVSGSDNLKCHICGIIFATQQEKQQHMKLEHQNKEEPTGVGWIKLQTSKFLMMSSFRI